MKIVSVGELLWDIFPDEEHLGGAPFNFAAHARRLGHDVILVSAVGADVLGERALTKVQEYGLPPRFVHSIEGQPTGTVSVSLNDEGVPTFVIHRPAAYDFLRLESSDYELISQKAPDWICFGTLFQTTAEARALIRCLVASNPAAGRFYDVNLRPCAYTPQLVRELLHDSTVVKLNDAEACELDKMFAFGTSSLEAFCKASRDRFRLHGVCVTKGPAGCAILIGDDYAEVPGYPVDVGDTVGAGDAFGAAFLHGLDRRWRAAEIGRFANRVGAIVASRKGAVPLWSLEECWQLTD